MADRDVGGANDPDAKRESVMFDMDFSARTIDQPALCEEQPVKGSRSEPGVPCGYGRMGYAIDD